MPELALGGGASSGLPPMEPVSPPANGARGALSDARSADAEGRRLMDRQQREMNPAFADVERLLNEPRPERPKLADVPKPPQDEGSLAKDSKQFTTSALLLAGLAGAFSRNHITTALNAFGSAMDGFHKGRLEQVASAQKEWKQASEAVITNTEARLAEYRAAFEDRKISIDELATRINLIATKYKDPLMMQAAASKNALMMAQLYEQTANANRQFDLSAKGMDQRHQEFLETQRDKTKSLTTAEGLIDFTKKIEDLRKTDPEQAEKVMKNFETLHPQLSVAANKLEQGQKGVEESARLIADYQSPPPSALAMRSANGSAIMAKVKELNPQYDATKWSVKAASA